MKESRIEHLKGNKRLTDYKETKDAVVANKVKNVPEAKKSRIKNKQIWLM